MSESSTSPPPIPLLRERVTVNERNLQAACKEFLASLKNDIHSALFDFTQSEGKTFQEFSRIWKEYDFGLIYGLGTSFSGTRQLIDAICKFLIEEFQSEMGTLSVQLGIGVIFFYYSLYMGQPCGTAGFKRYPVLMDEGSLALYKNLYSGELKSHSVEAAYAFYTLCQGNAIQLSLIDDDDDTLSMVGDRNSEMYGDGSHRKVSLHLQRVRSNLENSTIYGGLLPDEHSMISVLDYEYTATLRQLMPEIHTINSNVNGFGEDMRNMALVYGGKWEEVEAQVQQIVKERPPKRKSFGNIRAPYKPRQRKRTLSTTTSDTQIELPPRPSTTPPILFDTDSLSGGGMFEYFNFDGPASVGNDDGNMPDFTFFTRNNGKDNSRFEGDEEEEGDDY